VQAHLGADIGAAVIDSHHVGVARPEADLELGAIELRPRTESRDQETRQELERQHDAALAIVHRHVQQRFLIAIHDDARVDGHLQADGRRP
jgi:hypothetical protein